MMARENAGTRRPRRGQERARSGGPSADQDSERGLTHGGCNDALPRPAPSAGVPLASIIEHMFLFRQAMLELVVAGSGQDVLSHPAPDGTIFVTDTENHRMQAFDAEGNFLYLWGGLGIEDGQFSYPASARLDGEGNIYIADAEGGRLHKFTLSTATSMAATGTSVATPIA